MDPEGEGPPAESSLEARRWQQEEGCPQLELPEYTFGRRLGTFVRLSDVTAV